MHRRTRTNAPEKGTDRVIARSQQLQDDLDLLDEHAERVLAAVTAELDRQARRGLRAFALAPTLDIYHALMRGEQVPIDRLNPDAVRAYGLRRTA